MTSEQEQRLLIKEHVRKIANLQRHLNEQVYRFSQQTGDRDVQRVLSDVVSRGNENVQDLARLLATKCGT
ncbi:MAG: hypothetical protein ACM3UZ_09435 [Acidobacteriota bacterium]